jgi:F0F1-type ATP synthase assembly protein I
MPSPPIIIPVVIPRKRDCIVVNGKTYCQDEPATKQDVGAMCLVFIAIILYIVTTCWLADKFDNWMGRILITALILPFAIGVLLSFT